MPKPKYRVTPRALEDLKAIGRYSLQVWGKTQRNAYLNNLESRFRWLAENPLMGRRRFEIAEGFYCFPQGEHVVFYVIGSHGIDIIGIPHKEMDVDSHLSRPLQ